MTDFIVKKLPYALQFPRGLGTVGKHLSASDPCLVVPAFPRAYLVSPTASHLKVTLAFCVLGRIDFEAIETFPLVTLSSSAALGF